MIKRLLILIIAGCFFLASCSVSSVTSDLKSLDNDIEVTETPYSEPQLPSQKPTDRSAAADFSNSPTSTGENWAIYVYLCGSDLESDWGAATNDLNEIFEAGVPQNVTLVIQTGGAKTWYTQGIENDRLQRFVYDSNGFTLVDEQPLANMGKPSTLEDFLTFAEQNYSADKTGVIFWDHGGGTLGGITSDELYGQDSLLLDELEQAFYNVYGADSQNPPLEFIGFDACLMATLDTADIFKDYAKYLVASQETEPNGGWYYTNWLSDLYDNPSMNGAQLGKSICDSYMVGCDMDGEENVTLSVVDLSQLDPLLEAYEEFGAESIRLALQDPQFFTQFARVAENSENYGGNTDERGYFNMADFGNIARQHLNTMQSAPAVLDALDNAVIYNVKGAYRDEASGLSVYYSYDKDPNAFNTFIEQGAGESLKVFYNYMLNGELSPEMAAKYAPSADISAGLPHAYSIKDTNWQNKLLDLTDDGYAVLNLGPDAVNILSKIDFCLFYVDSGSNFIMSLGYDNDMISDWQNGVFTDNFRGVWPSLDGEMLFIELIEETADYNLYSSPILLNGEEYNLIFAYDIDSGEYNVLGATQPADESGMADKQMRGFEVGDVVTPVWIMGNLDDLNSFQAIEMDPVTITEDSALEDTELPDGEYWMLFEMTDALGDSAYSDPAVFTKYDGKINTFVFNE